MERNVYSVLTLTVEDDKKNNMLFISAFLKFSCKKYLLSNWAFTKETACGSLDTDTVWLGIWHHGAGEGSCKMFAGMLGKAGLKDVHVTDIS